MIALETDIVATGKLALWLSAVGARGLGFDTHRTRCRQLLATAAAFLSCVAERRR